MTNDESRLARTIAATIVVGLGSVAAAATAIFPSSWATGWFVSGAAGVWLFLGASLWRRRDLNVAADDAQVIPGGTLTAATWVTLARGLLISALGGFLLAPPAAGAAAWLPGAFYTAAALGDWLDGALARRRRQATKLGASLDVTTDAVGLVVAPLLAVARGRLPPWYLLLSAAYPLFQLGLRRRERRRKPTFRVRLRPYPRARLFAGVQMAVVATALYPVLPRWLLWPVASLAMLPTLVLFWREWRLATTTAIEPPPR
ncbi:MAG TPA: CDP-alcohol phosphatidyltransferase family protein [Polyangia bacterium]